ncbi:MAG: NAD-dependent epimerase/dehydratase family protein, partial [Deltaproteobacteria bacterium]|nr:NAD-dependent epimerase/dehydratase family protein [Deltaproteobacteria bacterium]
MKSNTTSFWLNRRVCVTGGQGFLGSWIMKWLSALGAHAVSCSRRSGCDLRHLDQGRRFFEEHQPEIVINCASNQGGIAYQKLYPGVIYYDNL